MAINVWRDFISKPRLSNHISPIAEIGYSHYGPTFAIAGTITALNAVVLVYNICVEITDQSGKVSHFMDWFAFRPAHYRMGNFSAMDLTMCSKFTIAPDKSHEHNTLFIDNGRFSEMKPLLKAIKDSWEESVIIASKEGKTAKLGTLFLEFRKLKLVVDAEARLKNMNYWAPGHYRAKIRVTTQNPKQFFDFERLFRIEKEDAKTLENNATSIVANICQQPQVLYSCATPSLTTKV
ncbi:MAG: hypothetical protein H6754_03900 [Candidatus Omnitrophica bacterium]|nr:hypothetical protein [Candidatus Omnitrophota bacterium]